MARIGIIAGCVACLALGLGALVFARRDATNDVARTATVVAPPALPTNDEARPEQPGFLGVVFARQSVEVAAGIDARLLDVAHQVGDRVARGDVLATLDAEAIRREVTAAQATLRAAQAEQQKAATELAEASEKLGRLERLEGTVSDEERATGRYQKKLAAARLEGARARVGEAAARIEQLRTTLADAQLTAPFDGVIAARYADPGAMVGPGRPIFRLISVDDLWVRFAVPEQHASVVAPRRCMRATLPSLETAIDGTIETIAPEVDMASRMLFVEARLAIPAAWKHRLPAGVTARVDVVDCKQ